MNKKYLVCLKISITYKDRLKINFYYRFKYYKFTLQFYLLKPYREGMRPQVDELWVVASVRI